MSKRSFTLMALFLATVLLMAGCGAAQGTQSPLGTTAGESGQATVAASFYPMYIMLLNVTKDTDIRVVDMTQPTTGCLHDYSATPGDMKNLEGASALVINGAGMESFMGKVLAQFPHLSVIEASKGIELIQGEGDEGENPHVWVSVSGAIQQVKNIGEGLEALFPAEADKIAANTLAYAAKLEDLRTRMHQELDGLPNRDVVTFHEAFPYFAQEFNLNIEGVIEREPGSEPSARELAETIDTINRLHVKALFAEPQYPATAANTIAKETGGKVYTLDPAVTGPVDADAYITIMESNLQVLKEALQ